MIIGQSQFGGRLNFVLPVLGKNNVYTENQQQGYNNMFHVLFHYDTKITRKSELQFDVSLFTLNI
jgi:hypothetical protein